MFIEIRWTNLSSRTRRKMLLILKQLGQMRTQDLSQCLQRKNQNIVRAIGLIEYVLRNMNDMRENGWDPFLRK
jgi:predicted transcriptional regulator